MLELDDSQFKSRQYKQMGNANSYSIKSQKDVKLNKIPARDLQFRYINGVTSYMPILNNTLCFECLDKSECHQYRYDSNL